MADNPNKARFTSKVTVGSETILATEIFDLVITSELDHPDMCSVTLTQTGKDAHATKIKPTDDFVVKLGHENDKDDYAFAGELTHQEPIFSNTGKSGGSMVLRGLNAMHSLARGKRSCAYAKDDGVTDKDIIDQVLQRNSSLKLTADYGKEEPKIKYPHVYQHNQTDLEFIRHRASRLGFHTFVRDKKLIFHALDSTPSGLTLVLNLARQTNDEGGMKIALERFVPRVSTTSQVTKVIVRCFNPASRKELVCTAPQASGGSTTFAADDGKSAISDKYPDSVLTRTDIPFSSTEEGNAIAASLLRERKLGYVTAEGSIPGDARLKPGMVVELVTGDPQCDGKYFITYVRHSYRSAGEDARYMTDFRAQRDATEQPAAQQG
ncbi:MAG: contractile injection system protein, VgrG/Pvc8 family [Polyangia bacterium]